MQQTVLLNTVQGAYSVSPQQLLQLQLLQQQQQQQLLQQGQNPTLEALTALLAQNPVLVAQLQNTLKAALLQSPIAPVQLIQSPTSSKDSDGHIKQVNCYHCGLSGSNNMKKNWN
jgi:hypothetical protein